MTLGYEAATLFCSRHNNVMSTFERQQLYIKKKQLKAQQSKYFKKLRHAVSELNNMKCRYE